MDIGCISLHINDVNKKVDVPIVLNSVSTMDEYEGDFDTRRNITSSFELEDFKRFNYEY